MRIVPTLTFIHDALPETARTSTRCWPRPRRSDEESRRPCRARRTPARRTRTRSPARTSRRRRARRGRRGGVTSRRVTAWSSSTSRRHHLARRRRPRTPPGRHPQGRPRRHARPDGDRRAGARHRPGHPAARAPDAHREGVRRHDPARRRDDTDDAEGEVTATASAGLDEDAVARRWRRSSATSSRCRPRCPRSRSTASAPTQRVRDGEEVELKARPVTVHELVVHDVASGLDPAGGAGRDVDVDCLGPLLQRHLHPGDRPRPRRRARRRRPPDRAAAHRRRPLHARARPHARPAR
jgi:hypothetical protein